MTSTFRRNFLITFLLLGFCAVVLGYMIFAGDYVQFNTPIGNVRFTLEIAKTQATRELGLMYRSNLAEDAGMLFVFDKPAVQSFWMKNTLIPLDMLFLDQNFVVIDIKEAVPSCTHDPCSLYTSAYPAQYVLELKAGQTKAKQIQLGDQAYWHQSRF